MNPTDFSTLHKRAFASAARGWREEEFEQLLSDPNVIWAGDSRAFALARIAGDEAELLTLACDPDHQRQGLAAACLTGLLEDASRRGVSRIFLDVAEDNQAALRLYEKMGFERAGMRRAYYRRADGASVDAFVFQKTLGQRA